MNKLAKQQLLKTENLHPDSYFQSVLAEANRLQLLKDFEFENIQMQLITLLTQRIKRYTHGESSSVRTEVAENIMQSILYNISIYLKSFPDADMSLEAIKQKTLVEMYQDGQKLINRQFDSAKKLLESVQKNSITTDNCAYYDTVQKGLAAFFPAYDADFAAHDTPGSIDYPLCNDHMDLVGIEYIYSYLQKLYLENEFCQKFKAQDIHYLLLGYDENYQDLLINIFELVLGNAIGCLLAEKNPLVLNIKEADRQYIRQKLINLPKDELTSILQEASGQLVKKLHISDESLQKHISATIIDLTPRVKEALANNQLAAVFISFKDAPKEPFIKFADGQKMDDELFRTIFKEIKRCRFVSDKIATIRREIHSLVDLVDILEGDCIFGSEFAEVFQSLEDMELALLLKKIPKYIVDANFHFTNNEKLWHDKLHSFLAQIDPDRRERIKELSEQISME